MTIHSFDITYPFTKSFTTNIDFRFSINNHINIQAAAELKTFKEFLNLQFRAIYNQDSAGLVSFISHKIFLEELKHSSEKYILKVTLNPNNSTALFNVKRVSVQQSLSVA